MPGPREVGEQAGACGPCREAPEGQYSCSAPDTHLWGLDSTGRRHAPPGWPAAACAAPLPVRRPCVHQRCPRCQPPPARAAPTPGAAVPPCSVRCCKGQMGADGQGVLGRRSASELKAGPPAQPGHGGSRRQQLWRGMHPAAAQVQGVAAQAPGLPHPALLHSGGGGSELRHSRVGWVAAVARVRHKIPPDLRAGRPGTGRHGGHVNGPMHKLCAPGLAHPRIPPILKAPLLVLPQCKARGKQRPPSTHLIPIRQMLVSKAIPARGWALGARRPWRNGGLWDGAHKGRGRGFVGWATTVSATPSCFCTAPCHPHVAQRPRSVCRQVSGSTHRPAAAPRAAHLHGAHVEASQEDTHRDDQIQHSLQQVGTGARVPAESAHRQARKRQAGEGGQEARVARAGGESSRALPGGGVEWRTGPVVAAGQCNRAPGPPPRCSWPPLPYNPQRTKGTWAGRRGPGHRVGWAPLPQCRRPPRPRARRQRYKGHGAGVAPC